MDYDIFFCATIIIAVFIIIYAHMKGKIDISAVLASGFVGTIVLITLGERWRFIYMILGFFIFGNFITKYKYSIKEKRKVAEGIRTFRNVFGNGGAATLYSLFFFVTQSPVFLFGILGAMATAAADTFATEIGQVHEKKPRLITNFKKVNVGRSGAVSTPGLIGSLIGSTLISLIPLLFGSIPQVFLIGTVSGFLGCIVDSFIGATIERKKIDKHMTNFIATFSGGAFATVLSAYSGIYI